MTWSHVERDVISRKVTNLPVWGLAATLLVHCLQCRKCRSTWIHEQSCVVCVSAAVEGQAKTGLPFHCGSDNSSTSSDGVTRMTSRRDFTCKNETKLKRKCLSLRNQSVVFPVDEESVYQRPVDESFYPAPFTNTIPSAIYPPAKVSQNSFFLCVLLFSFSFPMPSCLINQPSFYFESGIFTFWVHLYLNVVIIAPFQSIQCSSNCFTHWLRAIQAWKVRAAAEQYKKVN